MLICLPLKWLEDDERIKALKRNKHLPRAGLLLRTKFEVRHSENIGFLFKVALSFHVILLSKKRFFCNFAGNQLTADVSGKAKLSISCFQGATNTIVIPTRTLWISVMQTELFSLSTTVVAEHTVVHLFGLFSEKNYNFSLSSSGGGL